MTVNYICPRCGYETKQKLHIRRHLYEKKKPCPGKVRLIELTDDIKESILLNCVWHPPPPAPPPPNPQTIINQQINTYNTINACIQRLDPVDKITKVLNHTNKSLVEFDQHVMNILSPQIERLQDSSVNDDISMSTMDLYGLVDSVTTNMQPEQLNVVYDQTADKIMLFNEGTWKSYILDAGINELVACVKNTYLDHYEMYLIKKYTDSTMRAKSMAYEHIMVYYKFLACHDLKPAIFGMSDGEILGSHRSTYDIEEFFYKKFKEQTDDLRVSELRSTRASIANIIKRNTKTNILELNKVIMDLIHMDDAFRSATLQSIERLAL